jgi:hypothetical protein
VQNAADCKTWDDKYKCTVCEDWAHMDPVDESCSSIQFDLCKKYVGGKCTECNLYYLAPSTDGRSCVWSGITDAPGGVFGCQKHTGEGICDTCYPFFTLSEDKKECWSKVQNCATMDNKGNCTLCENINYSLVWDNQSD